MKKKLEPFGNVSSDLELVLERMTDPQGHDLQWGEVLFQVLEWLEVHAPHAQEMYKDGTRPVFQYRHRDHLK